MPHPLEFLGDLVEIVLPLDSPFQALLDSAISFHSDMHSEMKNTKAKIPMLFGTTKNYSDCLALVFWPL